MSEKSDAVARALTECGHRSFDGRHTCKLSADHPGAWHRAGLIMWCPWVGDKHGSGVFTIPASGFDDVVINRVTPVPEGVMATAQLVGQFTPIVTITGTAIAVAQPEQAPAPPKRASAPQAQRKRSASTHPRPVVQQGCEQRRGRYPQPPQCPPGRARRGR